MGNKAWFRIDGREISDDGGEVIYSTPRTEPLVGPCNGVFIATQVDGNGR